MADMNIIVGATDAASPVLRKVRAESDKLGQSLRRAAEASGRIGGSVGGVGGRVLGGLAMGGGFAAASLAGIGLMGVVNAIKSASDRAAEAARSNVQIAQQMTAITRNAQQALQGVMAGGLSQVSLQQRARGRGIREPARAFEGLGSYEETLQATMDAADMALSQTQMEQAALIARTGQVGLTAAVRGIALGRKPESLVAESLPAGTRDRMGVARGILERSRQTTTLSPIEDAQRAANKIPAAQAEGLRNGLAASALDAQAEAALNPAAAARRDMQRQVLETAAQMQAAADAQWRLVQIMDAGLSVVTGGATRTSQQKVNDYMQNNRAAWQGAP